MTIIPFMCLCLMAVYIHDTDVPLLKELDEQLREASEEGNIEEVKKLLQLGVGVDGTDKVSLIPCHGTIMSWYYHVVVLSCHGTIMSWYYHVMVLSCHGTIMSWYYHVMVLSCHGTIMSWYYLHPMPWQVCQYVVCTCMGYLLCGMYRCGYYNQYGPQK